MSALTQELVLTWTSANEGYNVAVWLLHRLCCRPKTSGWEKTLRDMAGLLAGSAVLLMGMEVGMYPWGRAVAREEAMKRMSVAE